MSTSLSLSRAFYATLDGEKLQYMSFRGREDEISASLQQLVEAASAASGDDIAALREGLFALRRILTAWRKYPGIGQRLGTGDAAVVITTTEYYYTAKDVVKPAPVSSLRFQIADLLASVIDANQPGMDSMLTSDLQKLLEQLVLVAEQKYWVWSNMVEDLGSEVADETPETEAETKTFTAILPRGSTSSDDSIVTDNATPSLVAPTSALPPTVTQTITDFTPTVPQTITDTTPARTGRKTGVQGKIASKGEKWLDDEYDFVQEHFFNVQPRPSYPQLYRAFNAHFAGTAVQTRQNGPISQRSQWKPASQDVSDQKARDADECHRTYNGLQQFVMKLLKVDDFEPKRNWAYNRSQQPAIAPTSMDAQAPSIPPPAPATMAPPPPQSVALTAAAPTSSAAASTATAEPRLEAFWQERGDFYELYISKD